jgi:hypothetical protein
MTSCAVSAPTPRSQPVGVTRSTSIIPGDAACLRTWRLGQQYSGSPGRELLAQQAGTRRGPARRVTQRLMGNRRRCPHRGPHRPTPPVTSSPGAERGGVIVMPAPAELDGDNNSAPHGELAAAKTAQVSGWGSR